MDHKKLAEIADNLEEKHIVGSAKGIQESKDILAMTQFFRIQQHNSLTKKTERENLADLIIFMNENYLKKDLDENMIIDDFLNNQNK